jgi:hypothetical protein
MMIIFYDDLVREQQKRRSRAPARPPAEPKEPAAADAKEPAPKAAAAAKAPKTSGDPEKAIELLMETVDALAGEQGGDQGVWGWKVKEAIKRRQPQFSERFHGFRSFNALVEAAGQRGLLDLLHDEKSGGYRMRQTTVPEDAAASE